MRHQKAFTLVEALISAVMFALVWLAAVEVMLAGRYVGSLAQHKAQAIYVAQRAIEDLHRKSFSQITGGTSSVSVDTKGTPDNTSDDLIGTQTITVTSPSSYYKKVIVEVAWNQPFAGISKLTRERCGTFICNDPQAN